MRVGRVGFGGYRIRIKIMAVYSGSYIEETRPPIGIARFIFSRERVKLSNSKSVRLVRSARTYPAEATHMIERGRVTSQSKRVLVTLKRENRGI